MKPSFRNTAITLSLLAVLGGGIYYSANDQKQNVASQLAIENRNKQSFDFTLNHRIENTQGKLNAFYCANNRTVCEFSDKDFKLSLPYGYSGFLLLESAYFNEKVKVPN